MFKIGKFDEEDACAVRQKEKGTISMCGNMRHNIAQWLSIAEKKVAEASAHINNHTKCNSTEIKSELAVANRFWDGR